MTAASRWLTRHRRAIRIVLALVAFGTVTFVSCLIADPKVHTGFAGYDDEGYMLIALQSFVEGGALYDDVFSQYGPFYYEAWGGVFSLFGIPVDLDSGRTATLVAWLLTSIVLGLSTFRMTGSIVLGIVVQMMVFAALGEVVSNEPMHPGGIICLLLALIVANASAVREHLSLGAMAALGGGVAALVLVKVNVGLFAIAAVVLACAVSYPTLAGRWRRLAVEVAFVATPIVLMGTKLDQTWARDYAVHVAIAALAIVIVLRSRQSGPRRAEELWWLGGGFLATAAAIALAIVGAGTSFGGLFEGLIEQPLRQAGAFMIPLSQSHDHIFLLDGIALGTALAYWYAARGRTAGAEPIWGAATSLFSILVGAEMALSVIGRALPFETVDFDAHQLSLLAFAWVALIPAPGRSSAAFARLLLPPLAVMQALHAYPVAGSQLLWSAFLLIPVGALCVASGVRGLSASLGEPRERRAAAALGVAAALALTIYVADTTLRQPLRDYREAYDASVPLDLPGARSVRLGEPEAVRYRQITAAIDANCHALVMLPGMYSFNFWLDQRPPTGYNATAWPTLFDERAQQRVIEDTRLIGDLCLLENRPLARSWSAGNYPRGPLVHYLGQGFEPIATFDDFRLLKRESALRADL